MPAIGFWGGGGSIPEFLREEYDIGREKALMAVRAVGREETDTEIELWPGHIGLAPLNKIRAMGPVRFEGMYQGNPVMPTGNMFRNHWWRYYDAPYNPGLDPPQYVIWAWDTAFDTKRASDPTVGMCAVMGASGTLYIVELIRARMEFPELEAEIVSAYSRRPSNVILIEKRGSGISVVQSLSRLMVPILPIEASKSKYDRARAASAFVAAGKIALPRGADWIPGWLDEFSAFPNGRHDDQVDAFCYMMAHLVQEEVREQMRELLTPEQQARSIAEYGKVGGDGMGGPDEIDEAMAEAGFSVLAL
jgi:predicted phage terminase large subunit-like protein